MANLTNEKAEFAIAIFRHCSPFFVIFRHCPPPPHYTQTPITPYVPGLDYGPDGTSYGASILIEKAMDPRQDVILALRMNGKVLNTYFKYGFPVSLFYHVV